MFSCRVTPGATHGNGGSGSGRAVFLSQTSKLSKSCAPKQWQPLYQFSLDPSRAVRCLEDIFAVYDGAPELKGVDTPAGGPGRAAAATSGAGGAAWFRGSFPGRVFCRGTAHVLAAREGDGGGPSRVPCGCAAEGQMTLSTSRHILVTADELPACMLHYPDAASDVRAQEPVVLGMPCLGSCPACNSSTRSFLSEMQLPVSVHYVPLSLNVYVDTHAGFCQFCSYAESDFTLLPALYLSMKKANT